MNLMMMVCFVLKYMYQMDKAPQRLQFGAMPITLKHLEIN